FMYRSPHGKTYLFTGDSLFPKGQSWGTLIWRFSGGRKSSLRASLGLLRELDPDVVIASACQGPTPVSMTSADEWHAIVDGAIERL
ncbi:MAG: MBL fold metallo-hydrolase, partial [Trinickia sp.]